ncbi:MAG: TolB family protein [Gemmatimonadales bacterium]
MSLTRWQWLVLMCLPLVFACSQSEPFTNPDVGNDGPLSSAEPLRLTYNIGEDLTPAVRPDGTELLYAFTRPDIPGGDQCLALLPVGGGTQRDFCPNSFGSRDSSDRYAEPAWIDAATIAVVRASRRLGRDRDDYLVLGTAASADPAHVTARIAFPYSTAAGIIHLFPTHVTPLGDGRLAYIAETQLSGFDCLPCPFELTHAGRNIVIADLGGSGPPTVVPGTDYPTGLSSGPNPGELLFTLADDSRIYRRAADGSVDVLHDFGGIARDVAWHAGRLAVIVGGNVDVPRSELGEPSQQDGGGRLEVLDLATGESLLPTESGLLSRRPSFAPDGHAVFVQTGSGAIDLYRVEVP